MDNALIKLEMEFKRAKQARANGNEGQARVCARRAAGIAAREYFIRKGDNPGNTSAYDLLSRLKDDPLLPYNLKLIAEHLTLRVTEEFKLPVNADLVADARKLCDELLK